MSRKLQSREHETNEESAAEVVEADCSTLPRIRGFVNFFRLDGNFGFIRTEKEIYYTHITNVRGETLLTRGDQVEFCVIPDLKRPGRFRAGDVQLIKRRQDVAECSPAPPGAEERHGIVETFDSGKGFGFISVKDWNELVFVHSENVCFNRIGQRHLVPGRWASFKVVRGVDGRLKALECHDISTETKSIDPVEYRENGRLLDWDGAKGWVLRPNGERIFLWSGHIVTLGAETLALGSWVRYGVGSRVRLDGRREWFAAKVEIFQADYDPASEVVIEPGSAEEFFLNVADPVEPVAAHEVEHVYTEAERKMSIRELIALKK